MATLKIARDTPQEVLNQFNAIDWPLVSAAQLRKVVEYLDATITRRAYPLRGKRTSGAKVGPLQVHDTVPQRILDVSNKIYWPDMPMLTRTRLCAELSTGATLFGLPKR